MHTIPTASWEAGIADLSQRLIQELADNQRVLWFLSGGSNIEAACEIMRRIPLEATTNLTIMLIDERYGPVGHSDSNWQKLLDAGFDGGQATLVPALEPAAPFNETARRYSELVENAISTNHTIIALLGIGEDGHIAGIMVGTPDTDDTALVSHFDTGQYQRITVTYAGLRRLTASYTFAFGDGKATAISNLVTSALPLESQPSQILKELAEAYLYSDQLGGPA